MMIGFRVNVKPGALAAGLLIGSSLLGAGVALAADAARGKILFTEKYGCYQCHGTEGQGSPITGPRLAPNPLFQVMFDYSEAGMLDLDLPGLTMQIVPVEIASAQFDLCLAVRPGDEMLVRVEYHKCRVSTQTLGE